MSQNINKVKKDLSEEIILDKKQIIDSYARSKNDTGSVEVQCAILTNRIKQLTVHLRSHKKDFSSRRGLFQLLSKRRGLLDYMKDKDHQRYQNIISSLNIKK